jgi:hypothetical protein
MPKAVERKGFGSFRFAVRPFAEGWAVIDTGYHDRQVAVCGEEDDARAIATLMNGDPGSAWVQHQAFIDRLGTPA